jgi:predicted HAD superfamily phosphohydrolase
VDAFKKRTEMTVKVQPIEEVEKELLETLSNIESKVIDVEAREIVFGDRSE